MRSKHRSTTHREPRVGLTFSSGFDGPELSRGGLSVLLSSSLRERLRVSVEGKVDDAERLPLDIPLSVRGVFNESDPDGDE